MYIDLLCLLLSGHNSSPARDETATQLGKNNACLESRPGGNCDVCRLPTDATCIDRAQFDTSDSQTASAESTLTLTVIV